MHRELKLGNTAKAERICEKGNLAVKGQRRQDSNDLRSRLKCSSVLKGEELREYRDCTLRRRCHVAAAILRSDKFTRKTEIPAASFLDLLETYYNLYFYHFQVQQSFRNVGLQKSNGFRSNEMNGF